ncbi:MAG: hypothetical protein HYX41_02480 [Bdellovibrio sp.]|nr:hypothetical protein [Bdellovibrio sp.]
MKGFLFFNHNRTIPDESVFQDSRGISILTVLPLVAISSALVLTIMSSTDTMSRATIASDIREEVNEILNTITLIGSDPVVCGLYFKNVNLNPTAPATETITRIPPAGSTYNVEFPFVAATQQIVAGPSGTGTQINPHLTVTSMYWDTKASLGGTAVQANFNMVLERVTNQIGFGQKTYYLKVPALGFDTDGTKVTNCLGSVSASLANTGWTTADLTTANCQKYSVNDFQCPDQMYAVALTVNNINTGLYALTLYDITCCVVRP